MEIINKLTPTPISDQTTNKRISSKLLFLIILLMSVSLAVGFVISGLLYKQSKDSNKLVETPAIPTPISRPTDKKLLFAVQSSDVSDTGRSWPTEDIVFTNIKGEITKNIASVGKVGEYPSEYLYDPKLETVFVNLEHTLVSVNINTGEKTLVFPGDSNEDLFLGPVISPDKTNILLGISKGMYKGNTSGMKLYRIELKSKNPTKVYDGGKITMDAPGLLPQKWGENNVILLRSYLPMGAIPWNFLINSDGSSFMKLDGNMNEMSDSGKYVASLTMSSEDAGKIIGCENGGPWWLPNKVSYYDVSLKKYDDIIYKQGFTYQIDGWSPDSRYLAITENKNDGKCGYTGEKKFYTYDVLEKKLQPETKDMSSEWYPEIVKVDETGKVFLSDQILEFNKKPFKFLGVVTN